MKGANRASFLRAFARTENSDLHRKYSTGEPQENKIARYEPQEGDDRVPVCRMAGRDKRATQNRLWHGERAWGRLLKKADKKSTVIKGVHKEGVERLGKSSLPRPSRAKDPRALLERKPQSE